MESEARGSMRKGSFDGDGSHRNYLGMQIGVVQCISIQSNVEYTSVLVLFLITELKQNFRINFILFLQKKRFFLICNMYVQKYQYPLL